VRTTVDTKVTVEGGVTVAVTTVGVTVGAQAVNTSITASIVSAFRQSFIAVSFVQLVSILVIKAVEVRLTEEKLWVKVSSPE
jgi:hypothetical protein